LSSEDGSSAHLAFCGKSNFCDEEGWPGSFHRHWSPTVSWLCRKGAWD
jgi:hypothetical protein